MEPKEFVELLKIEIRDSAVSEELEVLLEPPGRKPSDELVKNSTWYSSLDDEQKLIFRSILSNVSSRAVFGILCILDGVRPIESTPDKGRLELSYVKGTPTLLNPPDGVMLHELW